MKSFQHFLNEGKNDKSIFHVIFMAGGPGSGKSYVVEKLGLRYGLNYSDINSDAAFENELKKALLDKNMPASQDYERAIVRVVSKRTSSNKKRHAIDGRLAMVIDGTGKDNTKISSQKEALEKLGYECSMVFVDTFLDTSIERDIQRGKEGGRSLGPKAVASMWKGVQSNKSKFRNMFGSMFFIVENNSKGKTDSDGNSKFDKQILGIFKKIKSWSASIPNNKHVKDWIRDN